MPYILDLSKLELGDIILESGTTKFSGLIKFGTGSKYSHAMIYVGSSIIHALTDGVYSKNPQRIIVDDEKCLKVLRAKDKLTDKSKAIITQYARNLSGSLYNIPEAGASLLLNKAKKNAITTDQFCSRLVSQSYLQAGISIVKNPDYCSPEDLNKSQALIEVKDCLREATQEEVDFSETSDPIKENQRRMFDWLNKARDSFKKKGIVIQTDNDVQTALMSHPDLDDEICSYIKSSEYLEHFSYDKVVNPHRYDLDLFLKKSQETGLGIELFFGEINKEPNEITRHSTSLFQSGLNSTHLGLEYHRLHTELYKNLLSMSKDRLTTLLQFAQLIQQRKLVQICEYQLDYIAKII
ncbi:YiiX/YebB-like N1pC/P60 family cysteine hydrolase [Marinospirillum perlucidum]|uniref:YiiX/YebB-like N1pC/P60 family cysteine hydrolase n=1 Tax=Marinospirillum perlucidum TaxID=1982602 RepID=UPI0013904B7E|nr:YiiX/YebB-like N1pC/P60 family cysteine hydrolase [Marinospirillum perlucidum]